MWKLGKIECTNTLNQICKALAIFMEETMPMRKIESHDRICLDLLTAAQGGICSVLHTKLYVYTPR